MNNGNSAKKRGLGRGLGALIVNTGPPQADQDTAASEQEGIRLIAVDSIEPNPQQPRVHFDDAALDELALSIREHGILQPLIVTLNPQNVDKYWLIAGERRWRAAHLAGLPEVPVILRDASPQQLVEWALVENLQRADLNPLEEAAAYQTLSDEFGLTQADIAQRVGKSRSAVANTMRLLQLPLDAQEALTLEYISAGHARTLLALPDEPAIVAVLEEILARNLNVRQTEELVKRWLAQSLQAEDETNIEDDLAEDDPPEDANLAYIEDRFRVALGTRVNLNRNTDGSGRLVVHFYSDDDLNNLYLLMAGEEDIL